MTLVIVKNSIGETMTDQSHTPLLPCPFCGGPADFECCGSTPHATWSVGCVNEDEDCIGYQMLAHYNRKCEAAEAWNKRPVNSLPSLVKALEEIVNTPASKDYDYSETGSIKHGSRSYGPNWSAWYFQNIARAALSAYRGEGK